jgi:hypothetical protein
VGRGGSLRWGDELGEDALGELEGGGHAVAGVGLRALAGDDGDEVAHDAFGGLADGDGDGGSGDGVEDVCVHDVFVIVVGSRPFMTERGAAGRAVGGISGGHHVAPLPKAAP